MRSSNVIARYFAAVVIGALLSVNGAQAQLPALHGGLGAPNSGGASYSGPGDVVGSAKLFYGLRAYNLSYATGNGKLLNIVRASDSHACDVLAATNGGMGNTANCGTGGDNGQSASAFCNATTCAVATLYDQSGALACGGSACDLTQATSANRPTLTFNCVNTSLPCITFGASNTVVLSRASSPTQAQPVTYSTVAESTGTCGGSFCALFVSDSAGGYAGVGLDQTVNKLDVCAGTGGVCRATTAASGSAWHAMQAVLNAASSTGNVDGTTTTVASSPGTSGMANTLNMGNDTFSEDMVGKMTEVGAWGSGFTGTQQTNMCHNQFTYWGTSTSC